MERTAVESSNPERQTQVWEGINELEKGISQLEGAVERLAARLSAVLTEPHPDEAGDGKDSIAVVALAGNIRGNVNKITKLCDFVVSLFERLEI